MPAAESGVIIPEAGDCRRERASDVPRYRRGFPGRAAPFYRALGYEESAIYHRKVLDGQAMK